MIMTGDIVLTEDELAARLRNSEDPYVERKCAGDDRDVLKTAVAFANSLPTGVPGVLFMPATDAGVIQPANLDSLQKKISARLADAYPPIRYFQRVITVDQAEVIAVQVWGSADRPHFAGPSYIRDGSQTRKASESQFLQLIARRSAKGEEISKWLGRTVTVEMILPGLGPRVEQTLDATLEAINEWYITIAYSNPRGSGTERVSITLARVAVSFDHRKERLLLEVSR